MNQNNFSMGNLSLIYFQLYQLYLIIIFNSKKTNGKILK